MNAHNQKESCSDATLIQKLICQRNKAKKLNALRARKEGIAKNIHA